MMLRGKRVSLRAVEPEDLDLMYRIENDTEIWKYGTANVPYSRYALRRYIEETTCDIFVDGRLRLVIVDASGTSLGFIDLQNLDVRNRRSEVGIALLSEWQGQHYGTEAMELLLHYAAHHLHLHQLYAIVADENRVAIHMFLQSKFKPSGTLSEWLYNGASGYADASILTCILD